MSGIDCVCTTSGGTRCFNKKGETVFECGSDSKPCPQQKTLTVKTPPKPAPAPKEADCGFWQWLVVGCPVPGAVGCTGGVAATTTVDVIGSEGVELTPAGGVPLTFDPENLEYVTTDRTIITLTEGSGGMMSVNIEIANLPAVSFEGSGVHNRQLVLEIVSEGLTIDGSDLPPLPVTLQGVTIRDNRGFARDIQGSGPTVALDKAAYFDDQLDLSVSLTLKIDISAWNGNPNYRGKIRVILKAKEGQ